MTIAKGPSIATKGKLLVALPLAFQVVVLIGVAELRRPAERVLAYHRRNLDAAGREPAVKVTP